LNEISSDQETFIEFLYVSERIEIQRKIIYYFKATDDVGKEEMI
jgi:hypothetical protein